MAYKPEQWARAKFLFEMGLSTREIEADCGISFGQIGKRARRDGWQKDTEKQSLKSEIVEFERQKDTLEAKKDTILRRVSSLDAFEITLLDEMVTNEKGLKSLIFSAQTLAVVRANEALTKGKQIVPLKVKDYDEKGKVSGESYQLIEIPLGSEQIKNYTDAIDKAAVTLKVADRHAPKVEVNNTNAQQSNTEIKFERIGSTPTGAR